MTRYILKFGILLICFLSGSQLSTFNAQDSLNNNISLRLRSPIGNVDGYFHQLQGDTLWLASEFGPVSNTNRLTAYPAERIFSFTTYYEQTTRNNLGKGFLIGAGIGLLVAVATLPDCGSTSGFGAVGCGLVRAGAIPGGIILGGLTGGVIGLFIRSERKSGSRLRSRTEVLLGRPRRLQAQRERLEQLRWQEK